MLLSVYRLEFKTLEILRFDPVEARDVLFHVLDYLDLFGMEVESPLNSRFINFIPFVLRDKTVFMTEAPHHDLICPVSLEHRSFIVFQKQSEIGFIPESDIETLIKVTFFRIHPFVQVKLPVGLGSEISILWIWFGIEL